MSHQSGKAGRTRRPDSWFQREPQWTGKHNLWPRARSALHCPHTSLASVPVGETQQLKTHIKIHKKPPGASFPHLFSTQTHIKALEIFQAFAGEAGAALDAGDVGQRREVVVQQSSTSGLHVQGTVADTSWVGLGGQVGVSKSSFTCKHYLICKNMYS